MPTFRCQHLDDTSYATGIVIQARAHTVYLCHQCYGRLTNEDLTNLHVTPLLGLSVGRMIQVNMNTLLEA